VVGEAGTGKSVLLGAIAFGDFIRLIPVVLGGTQRGHDRYNALFAVEAHGQRRSDHDSKVMPSAALDLEEGSNAIAVEVKKVLLEFC